jgi:Mg2+/Co2+ transporter CorB
MHQAIQKMLEDKKKKRLFTENVHSRVWFVPEGGRLSPVMLKRKP